jgi:GTP-binding protein
MFTDKVTLSLAAGKGGNGIVAWRREKYIPKGGPTGGNGGRGGSIVLKADTQTFSLEKFHYQKQFHAQSGEQGGPNCRQGKMGKNLVLKVPCGTLVKGLDGQVIKDLTQDGEEFLICEGGKGGRGNHTFRSPTHQAPNICTPGKEGDSCTVELELKLIADIGFVGFPNAGKSTLFSKLAQVEVKIAPYPFTTLTPNLGFIEREDFTRIFLADIPGIIEDAHINRGLGLTFLRHIERTSLLLFVLDASGTDGRTPLQDWKVLQKELSAYGESMLEKPYFVVLNKMDVEGAEELAQEFIQETQINPELIFFTSAEQDSGIASLKEGLSLPLA